jgi:hypothetical protein
VVGTTYETRSSFVFSFFLFVRVVSKVGQCAVVGTTYETRSSSVFPLFFHSSELFRKLGSVRWSEPPMKQGVVSCFLFFFFVGVVRWLGGSVAKWLGG